MRGFEAEGVRPQILAKIEDVETILFMLTVNMGVTILPSYLSIPMTSRGRLQAVPFCLRRIISRWRRYGKEKIRIRP